MKRLGSSCSRPSYGRVLGSDVVGALVTALITAAGAGTGYMIAKSAGVKPVYGTVGGGAVGFVGSIYPSLATRRAVLRTSTCRDPGLGSIFLYMLAGSVLRATVAGVPRMALTGPAQNAVASVAGLAGFLTAPLLGQSIVKS